MPPHTPVLLDEVLAALAPAPGELIVDGTFGAGGYSRAFLDARRRGDRLRPRSVGAGLRRTVSAWRRAFRLVESADSRP